MCIVNFVLCVVCALQKEALEGVRCAACALYCWKGSLDGIVRFVVCSVRIAKGSIELQFGGCTLCSVRIASLEEIIGG